MQTAVTAAISAAVGGIVGFFINKILNAGSKAKERARERIRESPHFVLYPVTPPRFGLDHSMVLVSNGNVLCFGHDAVDEKLSGEWFVLLLVENRGYAVREIQAKLDGEPIRYITESEIEDAHGFEILAYPYVPEKRGNVQEFEFAFVSASALEDTHKYSTRHGIRELKRTDPPNSQ